MKTLTVTDREYEVIKHAIEVQNDITNDTLLENTSFNLFPSSDKPECLTLEQAKVLREELHEAIERQIAIRTLMSKLGLVVNEAGYSV